MKGFLLTLALCSCFGTVQATIVFEIGNHPQPDEENILLNSGMTGKTVTGTSNKSHVVVDFTSDKLELEPSSGPARVSADPEGTPLDVMAISLDDGGTYGDLIINPFIGDCSACVSGGTGIVTVNAVNIHGVPRAHVFTYLINNGNNLLTITTTGGDRIVSTTILDVGGSFNDLHQPRISELGAASAVPEPSTYGLLALGLGSITLLRSLRKV